MGDEGLAHAGAIPGSRMARHSHDSRTIWFMPLDGALGGASSARSGNVALRTPATKSRRRRGIALAIYRGSRDMRATI